MKAGAVKRIVSQCEHWLKLDQKEYGVNSLVTGDIQPISEVTYLFLNLKWVDILLCKLLCDSYKGQNRTIFVNAKHDPVSYFDKYWLIFSIIIGLLVGKRKRYSTGGIGTSHVSIGNKGQGQQVQ